MDTNTFDSDRSVWEIWIRNIFLSLNFVNEKLCTSQLRFRWAEEIHFQIQQHDVWQSHTFSSCTHSHKHNMEHAWVRSTSMAFRIQIWIHSSKYLLSKNGWRPINTRRSRNRSFSSVSLAFSSIVHDSVPFCSIRFDFYSISHSVYFCSSHHYTYAALFYHACIQKEREPLLFLVLAIHCDSVCTLRATCKIVSYAFLVDHRHRHHHRHRHRPRKRVLRARYRSHSTLTQLSLSLRVCEHVLVLKQLVSCNIIWFRWAAYAVSSFCSASLRERARGVCECFFLSFFIRTVFFPSCFVWYVCCYFVASFSMSIFFHCVNRLSFVRNWREKKKKRDTDGEESLKAEYQTWALHFVTAYDFLFGCRTDLSTYLPLGALCLLLMLMLCYAVCAWYAVDAVAVAIAAAVVVAAAALPFVPSGLWIIPYRVHCSHSLFLSAAVSRFGVLLVWCTHKSWAAVNVSHLWMFEREARIFSISLAFESCVVEFANTKNHGTPSQQPAAPAIKLTDRTKKKFS